MIITNIPREQMSCILLQYFMDFHAVYASLVKVFELQIFKYFWSKYSSTFEKYLYFNYKTFLYTHVIFIY